MSLRDKARGAMQTTVANGMLAYERMRTGVTYNPLDPRLYSDAYTLYRRLRERDPVHRSWLLNGWVLTRHRDVVSVLHDARFSADERNDPNFEKYMERSRKLGEEREYVPSMLRSDAPDHTRLRKLVSKAFTPSTIQKLEGKIELHRADGAGVGR